ncbi:expressed unknown protein [Seminavis robusta]|uniref:Uncharacterized protein n=1 Tax=Seminavis robusta TaxID=568900 RepID=A0A9N8ESA1_9STRA|nr:expressed unknown protein [Seminavis robusta]|eukprot:Sro1686_g291160.1 n/a (690) ;mRNA; r:15997-18162
MTFLACYDEVDGATFGILFTATLLSSWVAGSTYQWVVEKGLFRKDFLQKENQYNILVALSALSANLQTIGCFLNAVLLDSDDNNDSYGLTTALSINMLLMTHTSLMLVSRKVSLTYPNAEQTWQRLLYINLVMLPVSFMGAAIWATSHRNPEKQGWQRANAVFIPLSIGLWGLAEATLSSVFVHQMAKYQWTPVKYKGLSISSFVAFCDVVCFILAITVGDLTAMCLWGLLYSVRVRLEIRVVSSMIEHIQTKRASLMYTDSMNKDKSSRRRRRRRRKKRSSQSGDDDDESDCQSLGSNRSILSQMRVMIYPNDLTQLFKADFFTNVLSPGFVSRSLRSLASLAKRSLGGCGGTCPKCGKPMLLDDMTLGSIRSRNSNRSLKNELHDDFCACYDADEMSPTTEKTAKTSRGSSSMFVSPPMSEIRVKSAVAFNGVAEGAQVDDEADYDDNDSDSSDIISLNFDTSSRLPEITTNYTQQLSRRRLMDSLQKTSQKEDEEDSDSEEDEEESEEDEDEEESEAEDSESEECTSNDNDNDDKKSKASLAIRYCEKVLDHNFSELFLNVTSEDDSGESGVSSDDDDADDDESDREESSSTAGGTQSPASSSYPQQPEQSTAQSPLPSTEPREELPCNLDGTVASKPLVGCGDNNMNQYSQSAADDPVSQKQDSTGTVNEATREQLNQLEQLDCL